MRRTTFRVLTATLLIAFALTPAQAGLLGTFMFDEAGNASWTGNGGQPPAGVGIAGGGVTYDIAVTGGDLTPFLNKTFGFNEPGSQDISDVVQITGATKLAFFSDPGDPNLADLTNGVTLAMKFPTVDFRMDEVGDEDGVNKVVFTANVGNGNTIRFIAVSDTPEPSTILTASLGTVGLFLINWFRRRRHLV